MLKVDYLMTVEPEWIKATILGARNPLNSWNKSDSLCKDNNIKIGENDLELLKKLCKAGVEHRKYMRQMPILVGITAPLYWWKEADKYQIGTVTNSCSTMHKVTAKEFTFNDFSCEHLLPQGIDSLQMTIKQLNYWREIWLNGGTVFMEFGKEVEFEPKDKRAWWQIIQLLPSSYNQYRTLSLNYEVAYSIIKQRSGHKLDCWHVLVDAFKDLPYMREITGIE